MTSTRFHHQQGIALGPILFIVAIITVLAVAIAAGSGGFNAYIGTESAKAMAQVIISTCEDYQRAQQRVTMENGCDPTALDFTPNLGLPAGTTLNGAGLDQTGGNGTNLAGNGLCALFSPNGGKLLWKQVPAASLVSNISTAFGSNSDNAAFAGYPVVYGLYCIQGQGQCYPAVGSTNGNGALLFFLEGLTQNVCQQINNLTNAPFVFSSQQVAPQIAYSVFGAGSHGLVRTGTASVFGPGSTTVVTSESCAGDYFAGGGAGFATPQAYTFMCPLLIR
jgi:hypothetical protein